MTCSLFLPTELPCLSTSQSGEFSLLHRAQTTAHFIRKFWCFALNCSELRALALHSSQLNFVQSNTFYCLLYTVNKKQILRSVMLYTALFKVYDLVNIIKATFCIIKISFLCVSSHDNIPLIHLLLICIPKNNKLFNSFTL